MKVQPGHCQPTWEQSRGMGALSTSRGSRGSRRQASNGGWSPGGGVRGRALGHWHTEAEARTAYRRGFWRGIWLAPPRLLGDSRLRGGRLQGAPGLQREVFEAQI